MPLSDSALRLREFLVKNLCNLYYHEAIGADLNFPLFKLGPFDYLDYAQQELVHDSEMSKINCVSHLKRAMECEVDTFLSALNLKRQVKPLNFPTKIDWIESMGIFNSRSLSKLNRIRNEVEHDYSVPDIDDLEIYFELVNAFVHTIESCIFMLVNYSGEMLWIPIDNSVCDAVVKVSYSFSEPLVNYDFGLKCDEDKIIFNKELRLTFQPCERDDFLFAMRTFFLLCRATAVVNNKYVIKELNRVS